MNVTLHLPTADEAADRERYPVWFDHTRATALHTCNFWGMIRYMENKTLEVESRAMALEAGSAMHQAFAGQRIHRLHLDGTPQAYETLSRVFGDARGEQLAAYLYDSETDFTLKVLETSGFYDDPSDRRRTLSNLEASLLHYLQRYELDSYPTLVRDDFVGIEVPICFAVDFGDGDRLLYRGRVDAVSLDGEEPIVVENKTASNVGNKWEKQWDTSHQVTGYTLGASLLLGQEVNRAAVIGLQIPLPKQNAFTGYVHHHTNRSRVQIASFMRWLLAAYKVWKENRERPFESVRMTHSCYRYFRPCSFMPLCYLSDSDPPLSMGDLVDSAWHPTGEE